jgi:hypothetical protein
VPISKPDASGSRFSTAAGVNPHRFENRPFIACLTIRREFPDEAFIDSKMTDRVSQID